jgi:hypothetical protein
MDLYVGTNKGLTPKQVRHKCKLPTNAEDGELWRCARCSKWWTWKDAHRVGADFTSGWLLA